MAEINDNLYFVILAKKSDFDSQKLADTLSGILAVPRFDIINHIKHYWGLLYKTDNIEKAREVQRKLEEAGIGTLLRPLKELKKVSEPKILKKAVPEEAGLVFEEKGEKKSLLWDNFDMICACRIDMGINKKEMLPPDGKAKKWLTLTGFTPITVVAIAGEMAKKREKISKDVKTMYLLDLIGKPGLESIRISGYDFDYSYLGSRKEYNLFLNFKNLVLDIRKYLPDITQNQGIAGLENPAMMKNFKYNSIEDYEHEKLWLNQLK